MVEPRASATGRAKLRTQSSKAQRRERRGRGGKPRSAQRRREIEREGREGAKEERGDSGLGTRESGGRTLCEPQARARGYQGSDLRAAELRSRRHGIGASGFPALLFCCSAHSRPVAHAPGSWGGSVTGTPHSGQVGSGASSPDRRYPHFGQTSCPCARSSAYTHGPKPNRWNTRNRA